MRLLLRSSGLRNASLGGADSEYSSSLPSKKLGFRFIVTTSRAVLLPRFGGPEVLEVRNNASVPDLKPNEVLVRARAVSVNPLDTRGSSSAFINLSLSLSLSLRLVWLEMNLSYVLRIGSNIMMNFTPHDDFQFLLTFFHRRDIVFVFFFCFLNCLMDLENDGIL